MRDVVLYGRELTAQPFDRRVLQREFELVLGCKTSWFGELERRGVVPPAHRDPGGKRKWWLASEVTATLAAQGKRAAAA